MGVPVTVILVFWQDSVGCGGSGSLPTGGWIGDIRRHWPNTCITIRGDGHYGREEAMTWCETYGIDYIFGLSGNVVLDRLVEAAADDIRVRRAESQAEVLARPRRDALRGQVVGQGAAGRSPDRGQRQPRR